MFIAIGLVAIDLNATYDDLLANSLIPEKEIECVLAFSRDTGS